MNNLNVLSLFDGISCARVALNRAGISVKKYYASEIDKYAINISQKNFPDNMQLGDVKSVKGLEDIDLIIGGSPCQDLSIAKRGRQGLAGSRSSLFFEYVRLLKELHPKYFVLENVASMSKKDKQIITEHLGVEPIMINAALVSAQQRKRLFWTNIPGVQQPTDMNIYLKDILLEKTYTEKMKSYALTATYSKACPQDYSNKSNRQMVFKKPVRVGCAGGKGQGCRVYHVDGKSICLSSLGGGKGAQTGLYSIKEHVRKLHPIECERLQGLTDNYTEGISDTQRYKCLGNAFNVDVVAHILKNIKDVQNE